MKGWVYVITNKGLPNLVKVGFSSKDPRLRAAELDNTGSPHPYEVEYEILVENPERLERAVHRALHSKREGKEWFRCSVEEAVLAIRGEANRAGLMETYHKANRDAIEAREQAEQQRLNQERAAAKQAAEIAERKRLAEVEIQRVFAERRRPIDRVYAKRIASATTTCNTIGIVAAVAVGALVAPALGTATSSVNAPQGEGPMTVGFFLLLIPSFVVWALVMLWFSCGPKRALRAAWDRELEKVRRSL